MVSLAVLIEAFANAKLARDEHLNAEARLAAARAADPPAETISALASEAAYLAMRADFLGAAAEQLLPRDHERSVHVHAAAWAMQ